MGEEKEREEEIKTGIIEDVEFREGRWWYYVRYPDGTAEWVEEERLIAIPKEEEEKLRAVIPVAPPPPPVPVPPKKPVVGATVILTTDEEATIIVEHIEPGKFDVVIKETGELRTITEKDIKEIK